MLGSMDYRVAPQRGDIYVGHLLRVPGGQRAGHRALGVKCRSRLGRMGVGPDERWMWTTDRQTENC